MLNRIGGGWVRLELFGGQCGGQYAMGCANPGLIQIRADTADLGDARFNWMIVHECAHQIQFNNWSGITGHPKYASLFGSNIELLANCMASAWGCTAHGHSCSGQQISEASAVWSGGFR